jgi:predicted Zn-dependent protease
MRAPGWLLLLLALAACLPRFRSLPQNPLTSTLSVESEIEIGADIHRQIRASGALVTDPILLDYVNDLGQHLVAVTEPQPFVYRFNVIRDDQLNAFAVPGGYIYLHSAVVAQAGDVAELAGVLAHEVAHVRKRHIANAKQGEGLRSLAALAAIALSGGDPAVAALATGINVSMELKYTRDNESEADREGIGYMVRAGYDPRGMVRFFERIQASAGTYHGSGLPPYLFTHPALPERIGAGRAEIRRVAPPPGLRTEDDRLRAMQARLAALAKPVAGGTGMLARPDFDRAHIDPLLEQAASALAAEDLERAALILADAQQVEPADPRVALARADLAERRGDLPEARLHLRRAFELDPTVPLVQYRLGVVHKKLGERSRAVFYLEQAATNFGEGSTGRKRAEFEIEQSAWPLFEASGVAADEGDESRDRFAQGETVVWWGSIATRFLTRHPPIQVAWLDPSGAVALQESLRADPRHVASRLDTAAVPAGRWTVRVRAGDSPIEERAFELEAVGR